MSLFKPTELNSDSLICSQMNNLNSYEFFKHKTTTIQQLVKLTVVLMAINRDVSLLLKYYFMKIKNIYYRVWSDIIVTFRRRNPDLDEKEVNFKLILIISIVNAMNVWIFVFIFKIFGIFEFKQLKINILPLKQLNDSLSFFIQYVFPFIIINHFLIFRKKRYRLLIEKYSSTKNKYGDIYLYSVIIFTTIVVFAWGFYSGGIFRI